MFYKWPFSKISWIHSSFCNSSVLFWSRKISLWLQTERKLYWLLDSCINFVHQFYSTPAHQGQEIDNIILPWQDFSNTSVLSQFITHLVKTFSLITYQNNILTQDTYHKKALCNWSVFDELAYHSFTTIHVFICEHFSCWYFFLSKGSIICQSKILGRGKIIFVCNVLIVI